MSKKFAVLTPFLFLLIATPSMAQTFYFTGDTEILNGSVGNVSLNVDTTTPVGSLQLAILFDPSVIQAEDAVSSVANALFEKNIDNRTGKITIGMISLSGISGKIADLTFRGVSEGFSPLNISIVDLTDTSNNPLSGNALNTTIRVIAGQSYTISLPHIDISQNQTTAIPVTISAPANITAVNFTLHYNSSVIQILNAEKLLPSQLYTNIDNANGTAKFAVVFNNSISGDAVFMNLIVSATSLGYTSLEITGAEVSSEDFNVMSVSGLNGSITVFSPLKGDVNGDGRFDITDVTMVAWMVVGKVQPNLKADFNGNGRIDIGDLAKIAYYLLGKINEL